MFTGLVETVGRVRSIKRGAASSVLSIEAPAIMQGVRIGDSIATNGVCLTATRVDDVGFCADVMHETLRRSSLGALSAGSAVNLERAMPADGRFGGHIVAGHVDGVGTVQRIEKDDNAIWYTIAAGPEVLKYVVEKGSITIDGISLTVARVDSQSFAISAIPHTVSVTVLADRKPGDIVNLETDIIGKYVEKLLHFPQEEAALAPKQSSGITKEFLTRYGY